MKKHNIFYLKCEYDGIRNAVIEMKGGHDIILTEYQYAVINPATVSIVDEEQETISQIPLIHVLSITYPWV